MPTPIIIDTDPGIDDAVALLLAAASPELNILGVTAVAGNVAQSLACSNTFRVLAASGQSKPVFRGCEAPIIKPLPDDTADIHGKSGLGKISWPEVSAQPEPQHAVDFIIEQCLQNLETPITLCMLGPLTNLAMALVKQPDIIRGIREVVIMGGALNIAGNTSQYAEFNFYTDPIAAHIVFKSSLSITLCPLDITQRLLWPSGWLDQLPSSSHACILTGTMLSFYRSGSGGGLHDPAVIAWLLKPGLFTAEPCHIEIEIYNRNREGQCQTQWQASGRVNALTDVDVTGFFQLLSQRLASLD